ncbi:H-type small acid-soluble spore protein [Fictibacillus sp. WQ 8-8]|uniref:H-type small acid-soluble spore protein n=1 Tax=unclassified Fictibacillus TaxID=2644029 RepID=UPI0006A7E2E9|nr:MULTISPECIES: H-type small acid-soluble spore protein [unclassified Fictibacillus]MCQ6267398.1 H-type small acid-soluble spore protein [Fictibacillus sp. WQ 8-8]MED2974453.1 H-type small acid-soluble spore protein [Fictibacillus sp. B-59209]UZJ78302.1 H-type small acid-soluble spore protein [Fictibacillus sp. KU28468]SFE56707.1 small acid-soluble spore protein H (minor) [Bacillus sp. OV194]
MNVDRAKQIISSPSEIEVMYFGKPVWIESINSSSGTAWVHPNEEPDHDMEVPVSDLLEH